MLLKLFPESRSMADLKRSIAEVLYQLREIMSKPALLEVTSINSLKTEGWHGGRAFQPLVRYTLANFDLPWIETSTRLRCVKHNSAFLSWHRSL
ncbi:hypothetical protein KR51_00004010 [Rubidibacter lacunae KORDI 51-2]|uniref:Uncharacterized protein n=1 Tax=Rubidibacter lacunae KORDI 51-2 TaxID=582515 RepID=U5DED3_9CHRO|nr:hypothetical protein [Rubidibacter lacunae]ERN42873.1 hypothetical protein KR51_00004010 [Rubidibacter lacunae KORDI 51-2]